MKGHKVRIEKEVTIKPQKNLFVGELIVRLPAGRGTFLHSDFMDFEKVLGQPLSRVWGNSNKHEVKEGEIERIRSKAVSGDSFGDAMIKLLIMEEKVVTTLQNIIGRWD